MCQGEAILSDVFRFAEKIIGLPSKGLSRPFKVNDSIDRKKGSMDALGATGPCDAFHQDSLGSFGGREAGEMGLAAIGGGIPGTHNRALTAIDHGRTAPAGQVHKRHNVDTPGNLHRLWFDFKVITTSGGDGIVNQNMREPQADLDGFERGLKLRLVCDIAGVGVGVSYVFFDGRQAGRVSCDHDDAITAGRKTTDQGAAGTRPNL